MNPACARTGQCCQLLWIPYSPHQLRETWKAWRSGKGMAEDKVANTKTLLPADIDLIYPMLAGRSLGKSASGTKGTSIYAYGPCRNLDMIGGLSTCTIHANKPAVCRDYPCYGRPEKLADPNPGANRGCGFNRDPKAGTALDDQRMTIVPLSKDEF